MSNKLQQLLADEPTLPNVDLYLADGGLITRVRAPRLHEERKRVQYHDCRTRKEREADPRTPREIIRGAAA